MALPIAQLGQPVLRENALELSPDEITAPGVQQLIDGMLETLAAAGGVGLAAPQVFTNRRVFLAAVLPPPEPEAGRGIEIFINPQIVGVSEETGAAWEGCLSFPELLVLVERHLAVRIEYWNRRGEQRSLELQGFPARVVQHELDHLNGVLTLDRAVSSRHIIKASEFDAFKEGEEQPELE